MQQIIIVSIFILISFNSFGAEPVSPRLETDLSARIALEQIDIEKNIIEQSLIKETPIKQKQLKNSLLKNAATKAQQTRKLSSQSSQQILSTVSSAESDIVNNVPNTAVIVNRHGLVAMVEKQTENGWRAIAGEWIVLISQQDLNHLERLSIEVIERSEFESLGVILLRFRVPEVYDSLSAMEQILPQHLLEKLSRNYVYQTQSEYTPKIINRDKAAQTELALYTNVCKEPVKIGVIDTAIETDHLAFKRAKITQKNFIGNDFEQPKAHGTAVAGIFVGETNQSMPLLPNAQLFAASVFYPRNQFSQGATLMRLIDALNWQVQQGVSVINMSLTGPPNMILHQVIKKVRSKGIALIAAVGNDGPAASPLYPAAYSEVIAVTAVNKNAQIYRWANQGSHVEFSAFGVSVPTVRALGQTGRESGTSMATPVVSAMAACQLAQGVSQAALRQKLKALSKDLGVKGHDSVYGHGLLHPSL
jgi:minor extracellular protease Epr